MHRCVQKVEPGAIDRMMPREAARTAAAFCRCTATTDSSRGTRIGGLAIPTMARVLAGERRPSEFVRGHVERRLWPTRHALGHQPSLHRSGSKGGRVASPVAWPCRIDSRLMVRGRGDSRQCFFGHPSWRCWRPERRPGNGSVREHGVGEPALGFVRQRVGPLFIRTSSHDRRSWVGFRFERFRPTPHWGWMPKHWIA